MILVVLIGSVFEKLRYYFPIQKRCLDVKQVSLSGRRGS